jgi:hypothetical protein
MLIILLIGIVTILVMYFLIVPHFDSNTTATTFSDVISERDAGDVSYTFPGFPDEHKDRISQHITSPINNNSNLPKTNDFAQDLAISAFVIIPMAFGLKFLPVTEPAKSRGQTILDDYAKQSPDSPDRFSAQLDLAEQADVQMECTTTTQAVGKANIAVNNCSYSPVLNTFANMTVLLLKRAGLPYTKENGIPIFETLTTGVLIFQN